MSDYYKVKIFHSPDGEEIVRIIREGLQKDSFIHIDTVLDPVPGSSENVVAVFIVTPASEKDPALSERLMAFVGKNIPVIPVVPDTSTYPFYALPASLEPLRRLNAVGWNRGAFPGEMVLYAIRNHLGLVPLKEDCRFFISYSRKNENVARKIYEYFNGLNYWVFLDKESIGGGEEAQGAIMNAIHDRDFLLVLDSEESARSVWVAKELEAAIGSRIPVGVLQLERNVVTPLCFGLSTLKISKDPDALDLESVRMFVDRLIASKESYCSRCVRTLHDLAKLSNARLEMAGKRQYLFHAPSADSSGKSQRVLVEFEETGADLRRLYRLHQSRESKTRLKGAVLIHNQPSLSVLDREAVQWAVGREPLFITTLGEMKETLDNLLR